MPNLQDNAKKLFLNAPDAAGYLKPKNLTINIQTAHSISHKPNLQKTKSSKSQESAETQNAKNNSPSTGTNQPRKQTLDPSPFLILFIFLVFNVLKH
jgi:hypothetical protein